MPLQFYTRPSSEFFANVQRQRQYFVLLTLVAREMEPESAEDFSRIPCHTIGTLFQVILAIRIHHNKPTLVEHIQTMQIILSMRQSLQRL